jgi:hypothetical protein
LRADFEIASMILESKVADLRDFVVVRPDDVDRVERLNSRESMLHKVSCFLCAVEVQKYYWLRRKCVAAIMQNKVDRSLWVWVTPSLKTWKGRP